MAKIKTHWVKTTPFGDYSKTPDRINSRTSRNTMIIREAKKLGISVNHPGSKPIGRLLNEIAKAHEAQKSTKEIREELLEQEPDE